MKKIILIGTCSFCGDDCNVQSQICGSCARESSLGVNIYTGYPSETETKSNDNEKPLIFYTGIGTTFEKVCFTEEEFRNLIAKNTNNFKKICPYNPQTCDIEILMKWSGAEFD